ncbi:MAG: flavin monoamine oxidase family protein [Pseudobdellovibrionaceae bacterium]
MQKSRRDFIQSLLASSALLPVAGCASLDRLFMGDSLDEGDKVLIVGAGLAGLSAAYHLKKNQIPFRLFEGSSRMGGRVWTLKNLNISSRQGELGPDRIEADHMAFQSLAQELKVALIEFTTKESAAWFDNGRLLEGKDWRRESLELQKLFRTVQAESYGNLAQFLSAKNQEQLPKAVLLDRMSGKELLNRLETQMRPWMKSFLEQVIRSEWGVEPYEISALHLVHWVRDQFRPAGKKFFKVSGGTSNFTQALYDRIGGVIPDRFVKFQHQLTEIKRNEDENSWSLYFRTPTGVTEIKGRRVICTLPPALLRQVSGWDRLKFAAGKKKQISEQNLGNHSKIILGFQDRFWQDDPVLSSGGKLYMDLPTTSVAEGGDPVVSNLGSLHGLLEVQCGGDPGAQAGLHSIQQALKDLAKVNPNSSSYENISHIQNWRLYPWSKGSRAYLKPGQFQNFDPEIPFADGWTLAGDWLSLNWMGTMNGAILTGIEAANRFLKTSS